MSRTYYTYLPATDEYASIGLNKPYSRTISELYDLDGDALVGWSPIECFEFDLDFDEKKKLPRGDFPSLSNYYVFPAMNERAWKILSPVIGQLCQALPVIHPSGEPYFLIHIRNATDALDRSKSDFSAASDGRISNIYRYCFHEKMIQDLPIFRLPHMNGAVTIINDVFRNVVEKNKLKGLEFSSLEMTD